jgi:putative oxidoreductase
LRFSSFEAIDALQDVRSCYVWKGAYLRRLYSTFAGGWPGTGLLLMRVVAGSALIVRAGLTLRSDPTPLTVTIPALLLIAAGILLIAGLWTPIVGASVALTEIWKMLMLHGDKSGLLLLGTVGAALAMLGPGLWSIDARLYGWKRLEPTPRKRSFDSPS